MRSLHRIVLLAGVFLLGSCIFSEEKPDRISFQVDPALLQMSRVEVRLLDASGNPTSTLFNAPLNSLAQLQGLEARGYAGGTARFSIRGYRGTDLAYDITVTYDGTAVTSTQRNAVYTYHLINQSGTFLRAHLSAWGYDSIVDLDPVDTLSRSWFIKPTSVIYSATAEGGVYSWSPDTVPTTAGALDSTVLISGSTTFILKVTNLSSYQVSGVTINQGLSDEMFLNLNVPPNDGNRYNLGMFPYHAGTTVQFEDAGGTWVWDFPSLNLITDPVYGFRYVDLRLP